MPFRHPLNVVLLDEKSHLDADRVLESAPDVEWTSR